MSFRLYAHRGAARERPENTICAFERALELGADALELDVHATRDGTLVVAHDPDGRRMAGVASVIRETSLADVQAWDVGHGFVLDGERPFAGRGLRVPTLEEVLATFPGTPLNVDLKAPVAEAAVGLVRRMRAQDRVCLASFRASTLRRVRALGYEGETSLAREEVVQALALPAFCQRGPLEPAAQAAQLPVVLARPWVIARFRALGLRVDFWTVDDPAVARRLLALGADGIMTNDPGTLAKALRSGLPRPRDRSIIPG